MSAPDDIQHHILSVLVENKAGVLARVSGLFARRGFNLISLAVAPTEDERFSRITIVVDDDIDVTSTPEQMGKATGKDADKGKKSDDEKNDRPKDDWNVN